ncbi:MAG: TylF/MycF/NovP-related O-methyltransferase [Solirubrobacteraceae bacterium]
MTDDLPTLYVDTLERALTHTLYEPVDVDVQGRRSMRRLKNLLRRRGIVAMFGSPVDAANRDEGRDWPIFAHTMMGCRRMSNLRFCVERALEEDVPGDLIEAGVWRGGAGILMRGVLCARGVTDRDVWVADSFAGLPPPDVNAHPADSGADWHEWSQLVVTRSEVEANYRRYGLLDDRVHFLEGWFSETLPIVAERCWAVVRLDGDMYGSTMDSLKNLYPGLSTGGYIIVDDYFALPACRQAVDDYRAEHGITEPIQRIDWTGAYWRNEGTTMRNMPITSTAATRTDDATQDGGTQAEFDR